MKLTVTNNVSQDVEKTSTPTSRPSETAPHVTESGF